MKITDQEAWVARDNGREIIMPYYLKEVVEGIAFQARGSEFVDQKSGVSVRMTISDNGKFDQQRRATGDHK